MSQLVSHNISVRDSTRIRIRTQIQTRTQSQTRIRIQAQAQPRTQSQAQSQAQSQVQSQIQLDQTTQTRIQELSLALLAKLRAYIQTKYQTPTVSPFNGNIIDLTGCPVDLSKSTYHNCDMLDKFQRLFTPSENQLSNSNSWKPFAPIDNSINYEPFIPNIFDLFDSTDKINHSKLDVIDLSDSVDELTIHSKPDDLTKHSNSGGGQEHIEFELRGRKTSGKEQKPIYLKKDIGMPKIANEIFKNHKPDGIVVITKNVVFELFLKNIPADEKIQLVAYLQWQEGADKSILTVSKTSTKNENISIHNSNVLVLSSKDKNQCRFKFYLLKNTFRASKCRCCLNIFVRINGAEIPLAMYHINIQQRGHTIGSKFNATTDLLKQGILHYPIN